MSLLTLDIEKPAAGGRMLARQDGQVVLVSGAIPGERVTARIERAEKHVLFAETVEVLVSSPDRRAVTGDSRCGGNVFAHIAYSRQLTLKGQIIEDAFGRLGRVTLGATPPVMGSPEHGYRMRARLHVHGSRLGFYLEGTHQLCDAGMAAQLLPSTIEWIALAQSALESGRLTGGVAVDIAENREGTERACHLEVEPRADLRAFARLGEGLTGLSARSSDRRTVVTLTGTPLVTDVIRVADSTEPLRLRRSPMAFFQGNRYLLEPLVTHVCGLVPAGPVADLYAGVGLFGLALAAGRTEGVTLVEGDPVSALDLERNAEAFGGRVAVHRMSVEAFVGSSRTSRLRDATLVVDPPRTGLSKEATAGLSRLLAPRIVYVSCDVATLARDGRALMGAGYSLEHLTGIDLFPNTAHVESVAVFSR